MCLLISAILKFAVFELKSMFEFYFYLRWLLNKMLDEKYVLSYENMQLLALDKFVHVRVPTHINYNVFITLLNKLF